MTPSFAKGLIVGLGIALAFWGAVLGIAIALWH